MSASHATNLRLVTRVKRRQTLDGHFARFFLVYFSICEVVNGDDGESGCLRNVRDKEWDGECITSLTAQFIWLIDHFVDFIKV